MYFAGIFSDPVLHVHHSHALPKQFFMREAIIEDAFHQITRLRPMTRRTSLRASMPGGPAKLRPMTRWTSLRALRRGKSNEAPADDPQDVAPRAPAREVDEAPADASQDGHPRVLGGRGSGQPDIIVAHFILFGDSFFGASFTKAGFFGVHRVLSFRMLVGLFIFLEV